jgi:glycerophosphoryl diester phosphodiesterase
MSTTNLSDKIVIAHRGASGYVPEHTMESKAMAHAMNADYIEQDIVLSKDGIPIVIHDIYLEEVTDVALVYPERSREDGRFYVIDFNLDELMRLSVHERIDLSTKNAVFPNRYPLKKTSFRLHTLEDEIELIQGMNKSTGKNIGIYPEIKNPGFHRKQGKDISKIVLQVLTKKGYSKKSDACILQCFDAKELQRIRQELGCDLFLTQLLEFPQSLDDLEKYASFADAIGPSIEQLIMESVGKSLQEKKEFIERAHKLNLKVHAYTFRRDQHPNFENFEDLLEFGFNELELDGVFTDFPDTVVSFLEN